MYDFNPCLAADYYKLGHPFMQPPKTSRVFSTWTARSDKWHIADPDTDTHCKMTVVFGYQYTLREYFINFWNEHFFSKPLEELRAEYEEMMNSTFNKRYADFSKFEKLHKLGYLPIEVWGVPEGTILPINTPDHVLFNTHPDFAWLPQYLEDIWSANNWLPSTSATTAFYRRRLLKPYVQQMVKDPEAVLPHLCGDFSMRGHTSINAAAISGAGHLLSFDRTATVISNSLLKKYYNADLEHGAPGLGTPSLEHSVVEQGVAWMRNRLANGELPDYCHPYVDQAIAQGNWEINLVAEMCFILYLLNEVQPEGMMTYVSDTYDYWSVVGRILPLIKDVILNRKGCFSVRPDSGNPTKIICGDPEAPADSPEHWGTINLLLKIFGWGKNEKGYRILPPQIRMIYGDAITPKIIKDVCQYFVAQMISIENLAFGIGAYTYQVASRDTRGYAIKATYCEHDEYGPQMLFKAPKTAPWKASQRGCITIHDWNETYDMTQGLTLAQFLADDSNAMVKKFSDGEMYNEETFDAIRARLRKQEKELEGCDVL